MEVLLVLIPLSVLLAGAFVVACVAAIRGGQYDDLESPRWRMLFDTPSGRRKGGPGQDAGPDAMTDGNVERFVKKDVNAGAPARRRTPT